MFLAANISNLAASHALFTWSFLFFSLLTLVLYALDSSGDKQWELDFYQLAAFFSCLHSADGAKPLLFLCVCEFVSF